MGKEIRPQPGPQEEFLSSPADVVIYGGAAGGGKTYGMLLDALHYTRVRGFGAVFFRKNHNQIFSEGGLWDTSLDLYTGLPNAVPVLGRCQWKFLDPRGRTISRVSFKHIERDMDLGKWQGSQICGLYFDELTHFSEKTFFYMFSRNRSLCGVRPYTRASCNPDPDSWVAKFIEWWIDPKTGYAIPERSGVIRWFIRIEEVIHWADTREELWERFNLTTKTERDKPKSVTFIAASVYDNKLLLEKDPGYLANLEAMALVELERLLHGNWKIKAAAGLFFKRTQLGKRLDAVPTDVVRWVRCWDLAASEKTQKGDPAYTAGVLMGKRSNGRYIIADVVNRQMAASDVRKTILMTAQMDRDKYGDVRIRLPQDPGQAGKEQAESYIKFLSGFNVTTELESGSKATRAEPMAAQWQAGNFDILAGEWNEPYLLQLENFPDGKFKDMVDASANAFLEIETGQQPFAYSFVY